MKQRATAAEPDTINALLTHTFRTFPDRPALSARTGKTWKSITYRELQAAVRGAALGLRVLGLQTGDRMALISENRIEWAIADLAALSIGAVVVPIYTSVTAVQAGHILADSGARAVIAGTAQQLALCTADPERTPHLTIKIVIDAPAVDGSIAFSELEAIGKTAPGGEAALDAMIASARPGDLASLVYTSGTTGDPKGAMLTQGNFAAAVHCALDALPFAGENEILLSFLPLSHVFERVTHFISLGMGAHTYYNDSIFRLQENMAGVRPTMMQSVPRVYETIHDRIVETVHKAPAGRQRLFAWALSVGIAVARRKARKRWIGPILRLRHALADKLVLSKVRGRLGDRWRFFVSGGAPLASHTAEFFLGIGIPILEGYGLTESTAAAAVNRFERPTVGSVGVAMPGVHVERAEDGELLIYGPTIMRGYWGHPEATAAAIDVDGRLHTGDIGTIDRDGIIRITDRKKDIIVLASGKNVAPQPIEHRIKASPLIAEAVLLGDRAGTIGALVIPNFDRLHAKLAERADDVPADNEALAASPAARKLIKQEIDSLTGDLADFEKVRRVALLSKPLSIEAGELTPTMKVKRRIVQQHYGSLLD